MSGPGEPRPLVADLISAVAGGMVLVDADGVVALCNDAARRLFDRHDTLVGGRFGFPLVPNETATLDVRGGDAGSRRVEMRVIETTWGAERAFLVALRDLQEDSRVALQLEASEERFRTIFDQSPIGLAIIDAELRFSEVNDAMASMLGYEVDELIQRSLCDVVLADDADADAATYRDLVLGRARPHRAERRYVTKRGGMVWVEVTVSRLRPASDDRAAVVIVEDITDRREERSRMEQHALHDQLTGLANRVVAMDHIHLAQVRAERSGQFLAVLSIDLDDFSSVNDSSGHEAGDEVLTETGRRLRSVLRPADTLARLGGDEFVVLCEEMGGDVDDAQAAAIAVAERIVETMNHPVTCAGQRRVVTASVGIAFSRRSDPSPDVLLGRAGTAMRRSREQGPAGYQLFDEAHRARANERVALTSGLRLALERQELVLHYQPMVELDGGGLVGVEALLRWSDPARGLLLPAEFLDVAEKTGLIIPIGDWVLREACECLRRWLDRGDDGLVMSVNASARQLGRGELLDTLERVLDDTGIPAPSLHIELTEWMFVEADAATLAELEAVHELGVQLGLDDFGTGYASLTYLQRLPLDFMKIDRSFVVGINERSADHAIVAAIIGLGTALGLTVIAEGVETEAQGRALRDLGCRFGQGWHLGLPQPEAGISDLLLSAR